MADIYYEMDYRRSDGAQISAFPVRDINAGHNLRPDTAHKTNIVTAQTVLHLIKTSNEMTVGMLPSRPESNELSRASNKNEKLQMIMIAAYAKDYMKRITTMRETLEVAQRREILPPVRIGYVIIQKDVSITSHVAPKLDKEQIYVELFTFKAEGRSEERDTPLDNIVKR